MKNFEVQEAQPRPNFEMTVAIDPELQEEVLVQADAAGITKSELVRQMIRHCLDEME